MSLPAANAGVGVAMTEQEVRRAVRDGVLDALDIVLLSVERYAMRDDPEAAADFMNIRHGIDRLKENGK